MYVFVAINYKLLVEEDIEPWWEAVCAQKCSGGDGNLMNSNDIRAVLQKKLHMLEDKGETEEEFQREYKRKQRTFRETAKHFVFYGHEFAGDSAENWDTTGNYTHVYAHMHVFMLIHMWMFSYTHIYMYTCDFCRN